MQTGPVPANNLTINGWPCIIFLRLFCRWPETSAEVIHADWFTLSHQPQCSTTKWERRSPSAREQSQPCGDSHQKACIKSIVWLGTWILGTQCALWLTCALPSQIVYCNWSPSTWDSSPVGWLSLMFVTNQSPTHSMTAMLRGTSNVRVWPEPIWLSHFVALDTYFVTHFNIKCVELSIWWKSWGCRAITLPKQNWRLGWIFL